MVRIMRKRSHSVSVGMCFVGGGGYQENDGMHQIPDHIKSYKNSVFR